MTKFLNKIFHKEEEPSALKKVGKGILIGVGIVAGIAAVITIVEIILVKFFKKCITLTVQCTDLSSFDEEADVEEDEVDFDEADEETVTE